ncbi:dihydropteroate synthase [Campylobacter vulpis]|uniref:dihydropteroate synthase n=1 Tax=Campylobacter vulpis TaxID=1655500 RepID=UPI001BCBD356|nr:dihydropteroate synthase [Campylobacter vulpis]MBS4235250.1 dihydropteroate synthase [Campylobacter vulpis]MBS4268809.1 dihydropteroate synthase [Campylobacter vulpis]
MNYIKLNVNNDFNLLCDLIKPHKMGRKIMKEKANLHFIFIENISSPAANILKQDALSIGAELITNEEVIFKQKSSNALLIANKKQILSLIAKEKKQDFKLKSLADFLQKEFIKPKSVNLMAILNINEDSFNPSSRVSEKDFETRLNALLKLKPEFIDIGAVSSRPGSFYCGRKEEFFRLKNCLDLIYAKNYHTKTIFSLDSFDEYCLEYALNKGFKLINDITGLRNENLAKLAKNYDAFYCLMHMQNEPHNMQENPNYDNVILEIERFFSAKLEVLERYGVKKSILDIGFGFGKSAKHNMILLKNLEHFLQFNKPLLVGASRKSTINFYFESAVEKRLAGSLYLHLKAYENGVSIIRTHDLYEHKQLFALHRAYEEVAL